MVRRLEEKWRAMPPERELQVRMEILVEEQRGVDESRAVLDTAEPETKEYRLAYRNAGYFMGRVGRTQNRITLLRKQLGDTPPPMENVDEARSRKLAKLRSNSETMLGRFLVVTPGYNESFLERLSVTSLEGIDVDAILRAENIRLVSLDNPARWAEDGHKVNPQKFLALHPTDVVPAIKALVRSMTMTAFPEEERSERATIVWLPRKRNGWQHPDPDRSVYPPNIERIALDCSERKTEDGWGILRGWGKDLDGAIDPINGCEVAFTWVPKKKRYEALLDPDDIEEILL